MPLTKEQMAECDREVDLLVKFVKAKKTLSESEAYAMVYGKVVYSADSADVIMRPILRSGGTQ